MYFANMKISVVCSNETLRGEVELCQWGKKSKEIIESNTHLHKNLHRLAIYIILCIAS